MLGCILYKVLVLASFCRKIQFKNLLNLIFCAKKNPYLFLREFICYEEREGEDIGIIKTDLS